MTVALLFVTSCKTKKVITHTGPVPELSKAEIFNALEDHNYDFEWFSCVSSISVETPYEGVSGKAYIRMKKDSIIWSVVKKLSVEGARTLVTPESYAAINRIEGTYQRGNTKEVFKKNGVLLDFTDVQQALFGNVIIPDSSSSIITKEGIHYVMSAKDYDLDLEYHINGYTRHIDKVKMKDYKRRTILIEYKDYKDVDGKATLPFFRYISIPYSPDGVAELTLKIKDIELDVPKKTKFSIPSHYDRVY